MWVILFRGKHPDESTVTTRNGLVGIRVSDVYYNGWGGVYCSPNVKLEEFCDYLREMETVIRTNKWSHSSMKIVGDFNAKTTAWDGQRTDRRGTSLAGGFGASRPRRDYEWLTRLDATEG